MVTLGMNGICAYASNGHLEVLKWARTNGCSWGKSTCEYAARNGYLEILKWSRMNDCPWNKEKCMAMGRKNIVEWIKNN